MHRYHLRPHDHHLPALREPGGRPRLGLLQPALHGPHFGSGGGGRPAGACLVPGPTTPHLSARGGLHAHHVRGAVLPAEGAVQADAGGTSPGLCARPLPGDKNQGLAASKPKQKGLGAGALVSGGPLAKPMQHFANEKVASKTSKGGSSELRLKVVQLQAQVRAKLCEAELSTEIKNQQAAGALPSASEELQKVLQKMALEVVEKRCKELEAQASSLTKANEKLAPQAKTADKSERSLRKLQAKFEECETRRRSLEKESSVWRAALLLVLLPAPEKAPETAPETAAAARSLHLTIAELEKKLKNGQGGVAEQAATENKRHDEALAKAEQEKLHLAQRLEALEQEHQSTLEAEKQIQAKLARTQQASRSLDQQVAPFKAAVAQLREEQRKMRAEVAEVGSVFDGEIQKLLSATAGMAERTKALEHKYKMAMEDRKKLHNMVLDLKGNIRVFVRVRPINSKEKPNEPEGEATIGFKEDVNIGVFDGQHGRRKWFEFDQVFAPSCAQVQVFEEAKPLATSTLDGYNVCVFAYGQTGSGKTHTMTGTADDPGLNTRVLRELFRIRDERKNEYDIQISISITEIYNEAIRDLLNPSGKDKLDVRINQDGTCGVPGLTETAVLNVDDVLQCIGDAQKNRATSTTDMNEQSSRSHSIVTVRTKCTLRGSDTYVGKIHLIDLAGSENTNKSGVTGQGMKEAQNINKSLSALGDVIQSLVAKSSHTPYRNSKLTMMLKDSLGGDSKTLMIVCTSPAQSNVTEKTLSSLNFASRARNVELGKARRGAESSVAELGICGVFKDVGSNAQFLFPPTKAEVRLHLSHVDAEGSAKAMELFKLLDSDGDDLLSPRDCLKAFKGAARVVKERQEREGGQQRLSAFLRQHGLPDDMRIPRHKRLGGDQYSRALSLQRFLVQRHGSLHEAIQTMDSSGIGFVSQADFVRAILSEGYCVSELE
ncbi:unnamed protein product, partial [Effrenium voratum]